MPIIDLSFFGDLATLKIKPAYDTEGPKNISPVLLEIMLSAASSPLFRLLIELTVWTNIPVNQLLELTYGDLQTVDSGNLSIYYTYGEVSEVPLSEGLKAMLLPYVGKGQKWDFVFAHEDGSTWSDAYVKEQIDILSKAAGIECTLEDLKYSYYRMIADSIFEPKQKAKKKKYVQEAMK